MKIEKLNGGYAETLKPGDIVTWKDRSVPWSALEVQSELGPIGDNPGPFLRLKDPQGRALNVLVSELLLTSHSELQALAQFESIKEMVKALKGAVENGGEQGRDEEKEETAREAIEQDPLSVEVRSGWVALDDWGNEDQGAPAEEFKILLCTGGPAVRIIGTLDEHAEPDSARIEHQDWGTPWTEYRLSAEDQSILLQYCACFYFSC